MSIMNEKGENTEYWNKATNQTKVHYTCSVDYFYAINSGLSNIELTAHCFGFISKDTVLELIKSKAIT